MKSPTDQRDKVEEEAANWLAALDSGRADRTAFERWRAADPLHAIAFIRMDRLWRGLDRLGGSASEPEPASDGATASRRRVLATAGVTSLFAAGVGGAFFASQAAATTVETAVGERRRLYLTPQACLDLNTNSRLRWWRGGGGLQLELEHGEISLDLGTAAPTCMIHAGASQFRLGGGRFNVRLRTGDAVDLVTLAGEADMLQPRRQNVPQRRRLRLTRRAEEVDALSDNDIRTVAAWQSGELLFAGESLDEGVAEYNRYLPTPMELASSDIGALRLGGRFRANDPTEFLKALRVDFGIQTRVEANRIVLTR